MVYIEIFAAASEILVGVGKSLAQDYVRGVIVNAFPKRPSTVEHVLCYWDSSSVFLLPIGRKHH